MKINRKIFFVLILLTFSPSLNQLSHASSVEELEKRIEELEKKPTYMPKVGGYIEGWYRTDFSDLSTQTTSAKKVDNEFRIRRARIDVKGNVTDVIGYRVNTALDQSSPGSAYSVKLWDGYLAYKLHPYANITLGQFKYPFTLEGLEGTPDRIPVLRAESINDIAGKLGTQGGSFRDMGIQLNGNYQDLLNIKYAVAVINGAGINTGDNNNRKDLTGRVTISPVNGLTLGGSLYSGYGQDETEAFEVKESAYGIETEIIIKNLGLNIRGEYVKAKWENYNIEKSGGAGAQKGKEQIPNGWYLQTAYKLPPFPDLQVMARYEDYEKDSNIPDSHLRTTTIGATYYLKDKTRISANYLIRNADKGNVVAAQETNATGSKIGNMLLIQMLISY